LMRSSTSTFSSDIVTSWMRDDTLSKRRPVSAGGQQVGKEAK
jgi:hypothetical protein